MNRFRTNLRAEEIDEGLWELLEPLVYESDVFGTIVVPAQFVTDFASVPRLPFAYMVVGGRGNKAAVVHDWAYSNPGKFTRKQADDLFAEALKACGYGSLVTGLMWSGVRIGGGSAYDAPNLPQTPEVSERMAP